MLLLDQLKMAFKFEIFFQEITSDFHNGINGNFGEKVLVLGEKFGAECSPSNVEQIVTEGLLILAIVLSEIFKCISRNRYCLFPA